MSFDVTALPGATFGGLLTAPINAADLIFLAEASPTSLPLLLNEFNGFLLIKGMEMLEEKPELFLRLSQIFGTEVESYKETRMAKQNVHPEIPEILMVSNIPPADRKPPAQPNPPRNPDGSLPIQFPHRRGWHTDQSYRRPPPDISLFFCVVPAPKGQAQTLYANGIAAYEGLTLEMKTRINSLVGIHAKPGVGRGEVAVRAGEDPIEPVSYTHLTLPTILLV